MKHKEMLIAGNWGNQTFDLVPAKQNISEEKGYEYFGTLIEQIKEINPSFTFDFSRWPCLTIMNGQETVGVFAHPAPEQKHEHLKKFGCTTALYNGAFYDKHVLDDVKKVLALFNTELKDLSVRDDLGSKTEVANHSLNALTQGAFDHVHFAELRSLYLKPSALAENFMTMNGYEMGWLNGDRDRDISEEYINLLKENPAFFRFSSNQDDALDKELQEAFKVLDESVAEDQKKSLMAVNEAQKLVDEYHKKLKAEQEMVEKWMHELDLYWHPKKGNPYDKDKQKTATVCDKYGKELVTYKKGSGAVDLHAAGMHNEAALAFAAKLAYERFGHDKVYWNVSNSYRKSVGSEQDLALVADRTLEALMKAGFDPEQVVFPKDLQYLVQRKVDELKNNASFDQATHEQVATAQEVVDGIKQQAKADEALERLAVQTETIPDEPVQAPVVTDPVGDASAPAEPGSQRPSAAPARSKPAPAKRQVYMVNGCYIVKNHETDTYLLMGVKGKAPTGNAQTMQQVINKLAAKVNPDDPQAVIGQIKGTWMIDKPIHSLAEIKKYEDKIRAGYAGNDDDKMKAFKADYSYRFAYSVIADMSNPKPTPEPSPAIDIAGFEISHSITTPVPEFESQAAADAHVANVMNRPDAVKTEEYQDLAKAREEFANKDESVAEHTEEKDDFDKVMDGIMDDMFNTSGTDEIEAAMQERKTQAAKALTEAMASKANKINNKEKI